MGVKQAVAKQDEIPRDDLVSADLHQLALLHQLPTRLDQLVVPDPCLQPQHLLELVACLHAVVRRTCCVGDNPQGFCGVVKINRTLPLMFQIVLEEQFIPV